MTAFTATDAVPLVEVAGLCRDYHRAGDVVHAVRDVDLAVGRGELVAVHGRSGSGKTTLLNLIGGLDRPTSGRVGFDGIEVSSMSDRSLVALRRERIAFIFQAFGLLPILSAAENVEIPLRLVATDPVTRHQRVHDLLERVGLGDRGPHRPHELSGGEQQRVAIARALANDPELVIADEPTGQLDSATGRSIMLLIRELVDTRGLTVLLATHDPALMDVADRVIELRDGHVVAPDGGLASRATGS